MARKTRRDVNHLQLFMTHDELTSRFHPADVLVGDEEGEHFHGWKVGDEDEMWHAKNLENRKTGLHDDIGKHGIQHPVRLGFDDDRDLSHRPGVIINGHHRVAAARAHRQFIPVEYED